MSSDFIDETLILFQLGTWHIINQRPSAKTIEIDTTQLTAHRIDQNGSERVPAKSDAQQNRGLIIGCPCAQQLEKWTHHQAL